MTVSEAPALGERYIFGGVTAPTRGTESLLLLPPFQRMGKLSYSVYLWHWPILVIAAYYAGKTSLPFTQNIRWILVALVASIGTSSSRIRYATPKCSPGGVGPRSCSGCCSSTCTAVVGKYEVYIDEGHVTMVYTYFLQHAMERACAHVGAGVTRGSPKICFPVMSP